MASKDLSRVAPLAVPAFLLALGLGLRLWNATRGIDTLLTTTLPDDAFYYFGIARHLSIGDPPSIDGINPTNGYHPLWMALLVPMYWLWHAPDMLSAIRASLIVGAVLDTASGALIYRLCRRIGLGAFPSATALVLFAVNPHQVVNATCGLETPLALFAGLGLVWLYVDAFPGSPKPLRFGFVAGLALLARTDQVILVGCLYAASGWAMFRRSGFKDAARFSFRALGVTLATVAPWLVFSYETVGTIVQTSAISMSYVHRHMPEVWGMTHPSLTLTLERAVASVAEASAIIWHWQGLSTGTAALGFVALTFALGLCGKERRLAFFERCRPLAPLFVALFILFVAHTVVRWVFREWYTAPFIAGFALFAGLVVEFAVSWSHQQKNSLVATATATALAVWTSALVPAFGAPIYNQPRVGAPRAGLHEGHTDCGVLSYFSRRGITNLDGIVNSGALEALTHGRLLDYVEREHFQRIYATDYFHSRVFFGRRYREQLVRVDDTRAVRVAASPLEKDARIGPTDAPVALGDLSGREYLSDGWMWNRSARASVESVGAESELVVYLPRVKEDVALELKMRAVAVGPRGVQPVTVLLNGERVTTFDVAESPKIYTVPLGRAVHGRNRIRLSFGAPRARRAHTIDWWRTRDGDPVVAIEASSLWVRGLKMQAFVFPFVGEGRVACRGCYGPERNAKGSFRWTKGDAKLTLPRLPVDDAAECRLTLSLPRRTPVVVRWNGAPLTGANGIYLIPKAALVAPRDEDRVVEVTSPTFVPAAGPAGSRDRRTLGVVLEKLSVVCF